MTPRIYTSSLPSIQLHQRSIFSHLLYTSVDARSIGGFTATHPAFIDSITGTTITRAQLKQFSLSFAHGLQNHPGLVELKKNDTLVLYTSNSLAFPVVMFGTIALGIKFSPANSAYTAPELRHQYTNSQASLIVTDSSRLPIVVEMFKALGLPRAEVQKRIVIIGDDLGWATGTNSAHKPDPLRLTTFEELLTKGSINEELKFEGEEVHETCLVCYSSGTTGNPKGVETTHKNLTTVVDIAQTVHPLVHGEDRLLGVLPFSHIYGAVALILVPLRAGVPVIIQEKFDPPIFCENIQKYRITVTLIVPPILVVLARHPAIDNYDLSSLKYASSAAAPLGAELIRQVIRRFQEKGVDLSVTQAYGLTETSPVSHALPLSISAQKAGSIGILLPNLEARIIDDSNGDEIDASKGEPGELWIRGPTIMKGYLNNPKATADSITDDGWFKTGDICVRDEDGVYWIVDRRKELIKYKGFQVPPSELESVLLTHSDIADAAVIGVEDVNEATELPRAYIVHAHSEQIGTEGAQNAFAASVQKWIESKVATHKYLRGGVIVVEQIPKSPSGKILRRQLRDRAKNETPKSLQARL